MKKMLIAGGGYADIPLILAAKSLGFHVITSGNRADDLGHRYSDQVRLADFSGKEAMLDLARSLRIDAICACCNDFSALSAAYVAEEMGLPGHDPYETAKILHHKDRYRAFARDHGIPSPKAEGFSSLETAMRELNRFRLPAIIKPVDLTGGKGISKVEHLQEGRPALEAAFGRSQAGRVVIEEFIRGSRHGLSTFVRDGKVVFSFNDNEHYFLNPYLVSAASTPSVAPASVAQRLCSYVEKIASILSLGTGIVHLQYILRDEEPFIIEICRRAPGDLYTRFVSHATGVDYPAFIVGAAAGMDCSGLIQAEPQGFYTRHCVMASAPGRVRDVSIDPSVQTRIIDRLLWWRKGDIIEDHLTQKLGIVFLRFDSMAEMLDKTERMQELICVRLD
uniref:Phosphoribosylglycinamide synthetase, ATP-grasp (A) domain n=1 Tax=Candidatus Kentrum sp. FM TaxID=2126340 RepID=A0A450W2V3_9GAMM|nr:MAG: Phosphoribosylglycinamide synthetase, ATP-grasp (A) domain [Candidatus Kentron sp. FM]VFJ67624.1 MAG: Phosphoribosylglycinamide synthetase, ATP-grasp (A) domain [Candidatus Kentron sp. FM]VFK11390.1 MAG: Phosphoribosylglycinamide synthetase, ATP-grasp (A) domain [Candidatus Kentron sp. FM]